MHICIESYGFEHRVVTHFWAMGVLMGDSHDMGTYAYLRVNTINNGNLWWFARKVKILVTRGPHENS